MGMPLWKKLTYAIITLLILAALAYSAYRVVSLIRSRTSERDELAERAKQLEAALERTNNLYQQAVEIARIAEDKLNGLREQLAAAEANISRLEENNRQLDITISDIQRIREELGGGFDDASEIARRIADCAQRAIDIVSELQESGAEPD